ncbi:MAG: winged helix-turn-helix domain-containing protein, partial [Nannocystaceae bacterium]
MEILRHAKEPLHFSEIAEKAVAKRLLSHVGRDPESAMRNCLTSAVRGGKADSVIVRAKPGYYAIREGAVLPESPVEEEAPPKQAKKSRSRRGRKAAPAQTELPVDDVSEEDAEQEEEEVEADEEEAESEGDDEEVESEGEEDEEEAEAEDEADEPEPEPASGGEGAPSRRKRRRRGSMGGRFGVRGEAPAPQQVAVKPSRRGSDASKRKELLQRVTPIEFEAPEGSGIEGVTDVAVVMANAMSRLAEERPELRTELELMQQQAAAAAERAVRARQQQQQQQQPEPEERSARRRRRRRRRGRRVEWTESTRADR